MDNRGSILYILNFNLMNPTLREGRLRNFINKDGKETTKRVS